MCVTVHEYRLRSDKRGLLPAYQIGDKGKNIKNETRNESPTGNKREIFKKFRKSIMPFKY